MPAICLTEEARKASGLRMFRAPESQFDYGLASFDIRNVVHLSGSYELPFGKGKPYMAVRGRAATPCSEAGA